jgi:hypothetical protein
VLAHGEQDAFGSVIAALDQLTRSRGEFLSCFVV